ncbi:MAG: type II toxin-antitoxin system VapC family toxin [Desulfobacterales bacterium]|nr:type II toxin-antitoxin system VapC family toxin [Desulfobacterales bacterium]
MILDTCALLWLAHDQSRLSKETLEKIDQAPMVFIAAVTGYEIGVKYGAGKLKLPVPPREWISAILSHHQIEIIGLDLETCLRATELPPIHKDPCDRFIIATALLRDMPVATADRLFSDYGVTVLA